MKRSTQQRRSSVWLLAAILLCLGAPAGSAPVQAAQPTSTENWFSYRMAGTPVGYILEKTTVLDAGNVSTQARSRLVINRLGNKVDIEQNATTVEDAAGRLRTVISDLSMSKQATRQEATITGKQIELRTVAGDRNYKRTLTSSGELVGPDGIRKLTIAKLKHGGDRLTYDTFVAEFGDVRSFTRTVLGTESVGQPPVACIKVEETISGYPVRRTLWLDESGRLVKHVESGPFGLVEVSRTDRATALASVSGGSLPAEMFDQTLIRSNARLPSPRALERVVLRLAPKKPELGIPSFAGGNQRLLRREGAAQIIEVRRTDAGPDAEAENLDLRPYVVANALVQSDDPQIAQIARSVTGAVDDPMQAAKLLESWVHRNMHFDLGIAVAPASEIIRNRRGTCCAYATLLTALCRAHGLPARVAMGLVYTEGIWGGHFWTEVRIGDRWIALDAAIPSSGAADPARIVGKRSSLAGGVGADMGELWQLFTNLNVRVLEYQLDGRSTTVPAAAAAYTVQNGVYQNPWLGVTFRKLSGWRFTDMQAVYPDNTVVGAVAGRVHIRLRYKERRGGADSKGEDLTSTLQQLGYAGTPTQHTLGGRPDREVVTSSKAAAVVSIHGDLWILTVDGPSAGEFLQQLRTRLEWAR